MPSILRTLGHLPEAFRAPGVFKNWVRMGSHYAHLAPDGFPLEVRLRNGFELKAIDREELLVLWEIHVGRCYDVRPSDRTILDAGGNIGMFVLYAAAAAPESRIVTFEPYPPSYQRLVGHVTRNGLGKRVTAVNCALAAADGERQMHWNDPVPGPRRKLMLIGEAEAGADVVRTRSLASLIKELSIGSIDFVKMDIEGAEYETLLATPPEIFAAIGRMNIEIHEVHKDLHHSPDQIFAHLKRGGQEVVEWRPNAYGTGVARLRRA